MAQPSEAAATGSIPLRVITYNIRFATGNPSAGEEPWFVRCPRLCAQLRFATAGRPEAFLCLQEVLHPQLVDIQASLGQEWSHIGLGRNDGKQTGEYSPIFYQRNTWKYERGKTYWLSETPEKPSRGWDAALNRVVTVGAFRHRRTGTLVVIMSTHFDHIGVKAREESAKLILKLADQWSSEAMVAVPRLVCLGGDLNSTPEDGAYRTMTAAGKGMTDLVRQVPEDQRYGNEFTFTSFGQPNAKPTRIDFLFVKDTASIKCLTFGVLPNKFDDGIYLSDHRPVVADMEIPA